MKILRFPHENVFWYMAHRTNVTTLYEDGKIIKYLNYVVLGKCKSEMNYVDLETVMTSWIRKRKNLFNSMKNFPTYNSTCWSKCKKSLDSILAFNFFFLLFGQQKFQNRTKITYLNWICTDNDFNQTGAESFDLRINNAKFAFLVSHMLYFHHKLHRYMNTKLVCNRKQVFYRYTSFFLTKKEKDENGSMQRMPSVKLFS